MVVKLYVQGRLLLQVQLLAGLVPQLAAVGGDAWCHDAVHHDDAVGGQRREHLLNNLLQVAAVAADEDGIGGLGGRSLCCDSIAA